MYPKKIWHLILISQMNIIFDCLFKYILIFIKKSLINKTSFTLFIGIKFKYSSKINQYLDFSLLIKHAYEQCFRKLYLQLIYPPYF